MEIRPREKHGRALPAGWRTVAGAPPAARTRRGRVGAAAAAHGIPLGAIITSVAVVAATYLAGKLIYR